DVALADHRLSRRHGVRPDPLDHVHVGTDEEQHEHPDIRVGHVLQRPRGRREHPLSLLPKPSERQRLTAAGAQRVRHAGGTHTPAARTAGVRYALSVERSECRTLRETQLPKKWNVARAALYTPTARTRPR